MPPLTEAGDPVLEEHLERFREVFNEAAIGMATMTLTGRVVRANRALGRLTDVPAADLVGRFYGELAVSAREQFGAALEDINLRGVDLAQVEHDVAASNGRRVLATLAPVRDSGGRALYLFLQAQDVTAQRLAEEALRTSEERFRLLVAAVEDYAIFMLSPEGIVSSWNAGARAEQRLHGRGDHRPALPHVLPAGAPGQPASRARAGDGAEQGSYEEEGWRIRKDGTRFWASVVITAVYDERGNHLGFAKVTRDITDRRMLSEEREAASAALAKANAELELLNSRLRQSAEEQAQFLAVTAHELRTPVAVLGGTAETLVAHWQQMSDDERNEMLDGMATSANRLRRLLSDLLTASRLQSSALELKLRPVSVAEAVGAVVATVRRTHPQARIDVEMSSDQQVLADPDRLDQVLENVLGNALLHGVPPVQVGSRVRGSMVEIRVRDCGPGVPAELLPRLFQRFATGAARSGTGLGLFIVRELARAQGGDAVYEPGTGEPQSGGFMVSLPRVPTP